MPRQKLKPLAVQEAEAEAAVKQWNEQHSKGTPVIYRGHPEADPVATYTRSVAFVMGMHTACVFVEGHQGAVGLFAVKPDPSRPAKSPEA